jgi:hypothetical protein
MEVPMHDQSRTRGLDAASLALAALTAEEQARTAAVNALATASEILDTEGPHGLCMCQRVTLLASLEAAFGGFSVKVMETTLARAQEIGSGTYSLRDVELPGLTEQYLMSDPDGLSEDDEQDAHFEGTSVVDRVNEWTGEQSA